MGRKKISYVPCFPISVANLPPTQFSLVNGMAGARRAASIGGLTMTPTYSPDNKQRFLDQQECLDESAFRGDEHTDDEHSDNVVSLLEENARLRGLVVKLTDLILKNVTDRS
jgi:hypothetical protein